ncbi:MAG: hypothetical protein ACOWWO_13685 [Peptococcaceae bacterium]
MKSGAIVMTGKEKDKLYMIKGIINNKEGNKIAILEELCECSKSLSFEYLEDLKLIWSPQYLKDAIDEYDITDYDEKILMDKLKK